MGTVFAYVTGTYDPWQVAGALPPNVRGVSWVLPWSAIEPVQGQRDWSRVEACLGAAAAGIGRESMLRINPGGSSPPWVKPRAVITYQPLGPVSTRTVTMPIPWSATFLSAWCAFIADYGGHYDGDPRLQVVQLPGCGVAGEMALPDGTPSWSSLGYSDAKIIAAWQQVIDAYVAAFPRTQLALDIGEPLAQHVPPSTVMPAVHDHAVSKSPHIAIQQNGLKAGLRGQYPALLVADHTVRGVPVGWQAWGEAAQSGGLAGMLQTAKDSGACYVEVYAADCTAESDAVIAQWRASTPYLPLPRWFGPERRTMQRRVTERRQTERRAGGDRRRPT